MKSEVICIAIWLAAIWMMFHYCACGGTCYIDPAKDKCPTSCDTCVNVRTMK